ncbi:unnamed protein product [Acanthoscelides obtectus]|uniref:Uncharacterized protein n=1 Tax=Acanthoscelides obtectus TaxID=200917 RepID=A0A9P0QBF6_ACAOB|nr:unnamed protein product [Acanthoscelides obtectus]CAK1624352.1 hypothetical protein AOBTE_LOCUS2515 [Acanthoscelides obtectus]
MPRALQIEAMQLTKSRSKVQLCLQSMLRKIVQQLKEMDCYRTP